MTSQASKLSGPGSAWMSEIVSWLSLAQSTVRCQARLGKLPRHHFAKQPFGTRRKWPPRGTATDQAVRVGVYMMAFYSP